MINNKVVTPVGLSAKFVNTRKSDTQTPEQLEAKLSAGGFPVTLGKKLKGGYFSHVYEASAGGTPVVVKYTSDCSHPDPTVTPLRHDSHYTDTTILQYLASSQTIRVPRILFDLSPTFPLTVMEDLRSDDFKLLSDFIQSHELPLNASHQIGRDLAVLVKTLSLHPEFETSVSGPQLYFERGLELRQAYPELQEQYNKLEYRFLTAHQQLISPDTHPKNIFVNTDGRPAWIDFGFSVWGDRDFVLPNFLAHIVIYAIADIIPKEKALVFIREVTESYRTLLPIDDEVLVEYLAGEVLHRWAGRWLPGITSSRQKIRLVAFGLTIFDRRITTFEELLRLIREV